jgi:hypothetical protein
MKVQAEYFIVINKYTRLGRPNNHEVTMLTKVNKPQITIHSTSVYMTKMFEKGRERAKTRQNSLYFSPFP